MATLIVQLMLIGEAPGELEEDSSGTFVSR